MKLPCFLLVALLSGFGHEVKQTAKDFVTFRHPAWTLLAVAEIGADFADAKTTADCQRSPYCFERNAFLLGRHPDFHKVALMDLGMSAILATVSHRMLTHRPAPNLKTSDYWWLIPQTADVVDIAGAAYSNARLNLSSSTLWPMRIPQSAGKSWRTGGIEGRSRMLGAGLGI